MALVKYLKRVPLSGKSNHTEVECTIDVVSEDGVRFLQIDTYGSAERKIPGKKSQSLRLAPEAIRQLRQIIQDHGL